MSNSGMAQSEWHRRIRRAEELGARYTFAAEILRFYVVIARFQRKFSGSLAVRPETRLLGPVPSHPTRSFLLDRFHLTS